MIETINEHIEVLDWQHARQYVRKGDQALFRILEKISPGKELKFVKMRYPYGTTIMDNDQLFAPDQTYTTTPLALAELPKKIKDELSYRSIPFGFITENTIEIFKEYPDKVFSVSLSGPDKGIELGIFESFGLTTCYSVTAGARSVYMVPKISEMRYHKKITNKYGINIYQPKTIFKHWNVFKNLYATGNLSTPWETEIIYLTKRWDQLLSDKSSDWKDLKHYMDKKGFEHSGFGRKQVILNLVWEEMVSVIKDEGIRPDPYIIDTLKHLIYIFLESLTGSRPSTDDYAGPLTEIQKIYIDLYGLNQIPTIMRPHSFSYDENIPVYYSMQSPTMLSSTPNLKKTDTIVQEINSLIGIKDFLISRLSAIGNIKLNNMHLADILRGMKLEYFHGVQYSHGKNIRPTREIPNTDKDFLFSPDNSKDLAFAESGSFIKGCVKISKANLEL